MGAQASRLPLSLKSEISNPMTPYYNTPEKIASLAAAASRWLGTPFRENSAICGPRGGVSCHNLVSQLYIETGAVPPFTPPRGSARRLLHNPADTILAYIDTALAAHFMRVEPEARSRKSEAGKDTPPSAALSSALCPLVAPGDLLVLREGRIGKHVAIALPGILPQHTLRIIHVITYRGVQLSELSDPTYGAAILEIRRPVTPSTP